MRLPNELIAGDTWTFDREYDGYPAGTWTLAFYFKSPSGSWNFSGGEVVTNGSGFRVTKTAVNSATVAAGRYKYQAFVANAGTAERFQVEAGELVVRPNFATSGAIDDRSFSRKALDAIEAYFANAGNYHAASFAVGGRSLNRHTFEELLKLKSKFELEVARENAANGGPTPGKSYIRFVR